MDREDVARTTRRELIAGVVGAGAAGAIVIADSPAVAWAAAGPADDRTLLTTAVRFEQLAVLAYRKVLGLPVTSPRVRRLLRPMLAHNRAHARWLVREQTAFGYALPAPATSNPEIEQVLSDHHMSVPLAALDTLKKSVQLLLDIEALCEGAYYEMIGKLTRSDPIPRAAQALACDAQHSTLLASLLPKADITTTVPSWYVTGVT